MNNEVDLQQLAIERGGTGSVEGSRRRHFLTRYVFPASLLLGFLALVVWELRGFVLPARDVTVVPVFATRTVVRQQGSVLFKAAGWVEPRPTAIRVAALAPGVVEQLLVVEDQQVSAGEAVAELVKDDAQLLYDRAAADLELREAELDEAKAALIAATTRFENPVHLRAALGEADAALARVLRQLKDLPFATRRAESDLAAAQQEYEGKVAAKGVVAGVDIDRAKSALNSAESLVEELHARTGSLDGERIALSQRRDAIQKQLELLADEIEARDGSQAKVKAASARLVQAGVAVAAAQLRKDRMTVRAPVAGRVYHLVAEPGTTLSGGMESGTADGSTVVTLYRPDWLQVRVDVRFEDVPQVTLGQLVRIENAALSQPLGGRVLFVGSEADIQKNTLDVKVEILTPLSIIKPEMLVDVTFLATARKIEEMTGQREFRFFIPQELVQRDRDQEFVWLADQAGEVARRVPVETGIVDAKGYVEITRGASISDRIIAGGSEGLRDGDRIRVVGEEPTLGVED